MEELTNRTRKGSSLHFKLLILISSTNTSFILLISSSTQAFPKGSPLVPDISHAILNITDGEDIIRIEKKWIGDENCQNTGSIIIDSNSLNFYSFWGLFLITGVVTTISLLTFAIMSVCQKRRKMIKITSLEMSFNKTNDNGVLPTISQEEYQKSDIFGPPSDEHNTDSSPQMPQNDCQ